MKLNLILIGIILLSQLVSSTWQYPDAVSQLCFNVNSTAAITTGMNDTAFYSVAPIALLKNGSFWNNTLRLYNNQSNANLNLFLFAENSSHVFVFIPIVNSISAGNTDNYCVYTDSIDAEDITQIAPYGMAFDNQTQFTLLSQNGVVNTSWNGTAVLLNSTTASGFYTNFAPATVNNLTIYFKMKYNSSNTSTNTSKMGIFSGSTSSLTSLGYGVGIVSDKFAYGWNQFNTNISTYDTDWNIYKAQIIRGTSTTKYTNIYYENYSMKYSNATTITASNQGTLKYTYLATTRNSSAYFDWAIVGAFGSANNSWTAYNQTFDSIDTNISILAPTWKQAYTFEQPIILQIQYLQPYDNCSVYVNSNLFHIYTGLTPNQITSNVISTSNVSLGSNFINVSCYEGGIETHRYWYFENTGSDIDTLFINAFNITPSSLCTSDVLLNLTACTEYYKIDTPYNFSSVICNNLDTSADYSCLGVSNATHNNYTIFVSPNTWAYANNSTMHVGAVFYYSGVPINPGIEMISNNRFIYIPAQTKLRDCSVYYLNTSYCSWWNGFTINDRSVIVSDRDNFWYIAGGQGIVLYDTNQSQVVVNTQLLSLNGIINTGSNTSGMFLRLNCYSTNVNSFIINAINTNPQNYQLIVNGLTPYSYNLTSTQLIENISLVGVNNITLLANGRNICSYGNKSEILLPFNLSSLSINGFAILPTVILLFSVILSTVIPFALISTIIINDIYHILNITNMSIIFGMALIGGLVNNAISLDRGIKHLIILFGIFMAYIVIYSDILAPLNTSGQSVLNLDRLMPVWNSISALSDSAARGDLWGIALGSLAVLVDIFVQILLLPAIIITVLFNLMQYISPTLATGVMPFEGYLIFGATAYYYVKMIEILRNQFRNI